MGVQLHPTADKRKRHFKIQGFFRYLKTNIFWHESAIKLLFFLSPSSYFDIDLRSLLTVKNDHHKNTWILNMYQASKFDFVIFSTIIFPATLCILQRKRYKHFTRFARQKIRIPSIQAPFLFEVHRNNEGKNERSFLGLNPKKLQTSLHTWKHRISKSRPHLQVCIQPFYYRSHKCQDIYEQN